MSVEACIRALFEAKRAELTARPVDHQCCRDAADRVNFCNPENEAALIRRGRLRRQQATGLDHVYVCNKWGVHVCTEDACRMWQKTGTCPLTGRVHGGVYVDDLRYREVRGVKQLSGAALARKDLATSTHSSTVRVVRHQRVVTTTATPTPPQEQRTVDVTDLRLALLENLTEISRPATELRKKLAAVLVARDVAFEAKVGSMIELLRIYHEQTNLSNRDRLDAWIGTQLADYQRLVNALKAHAEKKAAFEQQRARPKVTRRRKLVSSSNMFGAGAQAVVVEEQEDLMAKEVEQAREQAEREARRKALAKKTRRAADGSLIVADRRSLAPRLEEEHVDKGAEEREARAARAKRAKLVKRALSRESCDTFRKRAKRFASHLLFGQPRVDVLRRFEEESRRSLQSAMRKYCSTIQRELTWIEKMEIGYNCHRAPPITELKYDPDLLDKYVDIVEHVWRVVVTHGPLEHCNAGERVVVLVTLATLYSIRTKGLVVRAITFLPRNSQMLHLPRLNDLRLFRCREHSRMPSYGRSFTLGCSLLKDSYEAALDAGVSVASLRVDLNDARVDTVREGDTMRDNTIEMFAVGKGRPRHRK